MNFPPDGLDGVNPFKDRVQVFWRQNNEEFSLGVFLFADVSKAHFTYGDTSKLSLVDQLLVLEQDTPASVSIPKGGSYTTALESLAAEVQRYGLFFEVDITPHYGRAPIAQAWKAGTSRYKIMDEICEAIGYFQQAVALRPDFTLARGDICRAEANRKNYVAAAGCFEQLITDDIAVADDYTDAVHLYTIMGQSDKAGRLMQMAEERGYNPMKERTQP